MTDRRSNLHGNRLAPICRPFAPRSFRHVPWMPSMGWTFFATMFLPFLFYRPLSRAALVLLWGATTYIGPYAILPVEETMSVF